MKKTIVISEDGMFSSEPMPVTELADLACAAVTSAVQQVRRQYADDPNAPKIDRELFDCLNHSFSKCLELTFPEYELHPELTEEVLKMEDELLRKKVAEAEADADDQIPGQMNIIDFIPKAEEEVPEEETEEGE